MRARVTVLAVLALAFAAAPAHAGGSHLLKLYKVEQHIDLEGEDGFYDLSCNGTDIAVDGMYRIDQVDQDNDFTRIELLRGVWQTAAYPTSDSSYRFQFTPTLGGDVQVKLWLTCLGRLSEPAQGHQHTWSLTQQQIADPHLALAAGVHQFNHGAGDCAASEIAVQPGWRLDSPTGGQIVPFRSWPTVNFRNWSIALLASQASDVTLFRSCLSLRSSLVNSHRHRIVDLYRPNFGGSQRFLPIFDNRRDQDLHCGDHYKAMVGGWWIDDPYFVWWFGMEPRPKTRTFWFGHEGGGSNTVYLGAHCFKIRST